MSRCGLWFGTEQRMQWIETPLSGAASTPESWRAGNVLLNGGASVTHSWDSHKLYNYSWRNSSARQAAQLMKSYRDGSYGRGLIYFVDPLIYDTNVLPARWADPSIVADYEGPSHVTGVDAELVSLSAPASSGFPLNGVRYNLNGVIPGYRPEDSVFIPIPEGYKLWLGSYYSYTGSGGVFYAPVTNGVVGAITRVPPLDPNESVIHNFMVPESADGIRLFVGRQVADPSSVTLGGMTARLVDAATSVAPPPPNPNLVTNGDFEGGVSGWTGSGAPTLVVSDSAHSGSNTLGVTGISASTSVTYKTGELLPLQPSRTYQIQGWVRLGEDAEPPTSSTPTVRLYLRGVTESGAVITATSIGITPMQSLSRDWTPLSGAYTVPVGWEWGGNIGVGVGPDAPGLWTEWDDISVVDLEPNLAAAPVNRYLRGPWIGGQGHSGCRFDTDPTYIEYNGVNGGQVGYGATFREVGSWV